MDAPAPLCLYVEDQPREAVACLPADEQDVLHERRHAYLILKMPSWKSPLKIAE